MEGGGEFCTKLVEGEKCGSPLRAIDYRWCRVCRTKYMRDWRTNRIDTFASLLGRLGEVEDELAALRASRR